MRIAQRFIPVLLGAGFCVAGGYARPANAPQANQNVQVLEVTAKKYEFNPSPVHVKLGAKVQLKVTAVDRSHGFSVNVYPDGSDAKGDPGLVFTSKEECWKLEKDAAVTVEFVAHTAGTYSFKCCVRCGLGHGGMKGQLVVEP
jgi:heme/copper-type cytochrome/quinol oxidase subunit 2